MIDFITPFGIILLLVGLIAKILNATPLASKTLLHRGAVLLLLLITFINFGDYSLFNFVYGIVGFFSLPTLVLLSLFSLRQFGFGSTELSRTSKTLLASSTLLISVVLYPSATGFFDTDIYSFGYAYPISILLVTLALVALWFKQSLLALIYIVAWLAWLLQLNSSPNGFDYVLDFWLVAWSLMFLVSLLIGKLKGSR